MSSITKSRIELVDHVVNKFVSHFGIPLGESFSETEFLAIYDPQVRWFDHAFHICRRGHAAIVGLKKTFTHCNQPLVNEIKKVYTTSSGAVIELIWDGCCKNDIVRPNGEVAVKASGRDFRAHVCFILEIDTEGRISRIDEYYNRKWDEGMDESEYVVMGDQTVKA